MPMKNFFKKWFLNAANWALKKRLGLFKISPEVGNLNEASLWVRIWKSFLFYNLNFMLINMACRQANFPLKRNVLKEFLSSTDELL